MSCILYEFSASPITDLCIFFHFHKCNRFLPLNDINICCLWPTLFRNRNAPFFLTLRWLIVLLEAAIERKKEIGRDRQMGLDKERERERATSVKWYLIFLADFCVEQHQQRGMDIRWETNPLKELTIIVLTCTAWPDNDRGEGTRLRPRPPGIV